MAAIVGFAGLAPVLAALRAGVDVALANKESLVAGGALVRSACAASGARVLPVDSEHSALFQALQGEQRGEVARFILTASGGPFLKFSKDQLAQVTVEQALRHPTWNMGPKVTIDSATLMNKALEFIEAAWLFAADESKISVVIHPQSIIHSLIAFQDGTQMAQLSIPDMKGPIAYALHYPRGRLPNVMRTLDLAAVGKLEFLEPDNGRFPALNLARESLRRGGCYPALFNAANEVAVRAFLERKLQFSEIVPSIERALQAAAPSEYAGYEELEEFVASSKRDLFAALGLMCEDRY